MFSFDVIAVDAWRDTGGGWFWNTTFILATDQRLEKLTPRSILSWLRQEAYLSDFSKGKVQVVDDDTIIEIQKKDTQEPFLALVCVKEVEA